MPSEKLFEFGGQWIGRVGGSRQLYRFWYDSRNGEVRRRSLKTENIEEAKTKLAELIIKDTPASANDPDQVPLVYVLTHYLEGHSDGRPSAHVARRAAELVMQFLEKKCGFEANVKTAKFGILYQTEFARWCAAEFGHSPAYVSRVLSVVATAGKFAARSKLLKNSAGELVEARLLRFAPDVRYDTKWLADVMDAPEPKPRDYVPSYEELASLIDLDAGDILQRYDIIALNTWARPEAIVELNVRQQVDFTNELLDLNPSGRRQNKKHRPVIRLTTNLKGWLEHWNEDRPLSYTAILQDGTQTRKPALHVKAQFNRRSTRWMLLCSGENGETIDELFRLARQGSPNHLRDELAKAEAKGIRRITRYTLRHFMATKVRGLTKSNVAREQRSHWLGHGKRDATSWYETRDPEFLHECALATCEVIDRLDALMTRSLMPPTTRQMRSLSKATKRSFAAS